MRAQVRALATDPVAQVAASGYLEAGGDAVGAAVCGFFAAAGEHPGVLLGPAVLMLARVGVGVRAFDGRSRQPGLGLRRRKGYESPEDAPAAAHAAVPTGLAALLVALRYGQGLGISKVVSPGVTVAERNGSSRRAEALEAIQRLGASALVDPIFRRPLLHCGGPTEGGLLTQDDLRAVPVVDHPAAAVGLRYHLPWGPKNRAPNTISNSGVNPGLITQDAGGGVAVLGYSNTSNGLSLPELDLMLPLVAVPAQRGVVRTPAGQVLEWDRNVQIGFSESGSPETGSVDVADLAGGTSRTLELLPGVVDDTSWAPQAKRTEA